MLTLTDYQIWIKAGGGDPSILSDPRVSTLRDGHGWTPLHLLASRGVKGTLKHPDASKVKNKNGNTPLHWSARRGIKEAWLHPDFNKVKNNRGETPRDIWIIYDHKPPTCADFINRF